MGFFFFLARIVPTLFAVYSKASYPLPAEFKEAGDADVRRLRVFNMALSFEVCNMWRRARNTCVTFLALFGFDLVEFAGNVDVHMFFCNLHINDCV